MVNRNQERQQYMIRGAITLISTITICWLGVCLILLAISVWIGGS